LSDGNVLRNIYLCPVNRTRRRCVAWLGILGIAFAQLAVSAHACMIGAKTAENLAATVPAMPQHRHCGETGENTPLAPQANACEVQCTEGAPSAGTPDLPPIVLTSLPVSVAPVSTLASLRYWGRSVLAANSAAPPLALQFCRLLI
jgi:hypothetical protein